MVIPGGCTSQFQAPDVSWNKPLKDKMPKEYDEWMLNGPKTYTKANNIRALTKNEVVDMLVKCWNEIPETLIKKYFVVCGHTKNAKPSDIRCMKEGMKLNFMLEEMELVFKKPSSFEISTNQANMLPDDFEHETN
jgi:hypothetical protein